MFFESQPNPNCITVPHDFERLLVKLIKLRKQNKENCGRNFKTSSGEELLCHLLFFRSFETWKEVHEVTVTNV